MELKKSLLKDLEFLFHYKLVNIKENNLKLLIDLNLNLLIILILHI